MLEWTFPSPPSPLKILHRWVEVDQLTPREMKGNKIAGVAEISANGIRLDPRITPEHAVETLLHEIQHILWSMMFFSRHDAAPPPVEEEVITQLSIGLACVFADNPDLLVWMRECFVDA